MSRRNELWLVVSLFIMSLLARTLIAAVYQFDGLYGQDSYAYYDFARALSEGHAPSAFFWPLGYPALLAGGFSLFGESARVGLSINLLLGAALTPLVYILARQTGCGHFGASIAAILMMACGQALQSSLVLMSDIPALFWATLSAVFLFHSWHVNRARWLALSAFMLALASVTRWLSLSLAVPWMLAALLIWRGHWRDLSFAALAALVVFVPQVFYSHTNPYPTLNHAWVQGWSPGNAFEREFVNIDGHFLYEYVNAIFYAQVFHEPYYLAPVFTPFLLLGVAAILKRLELAIVIVLLGWILVPWGFLTGIPYQNIRFPLIVFPAVAALVGVGLQATAKWLPKMVAKILPVGARCTLAQMRIAYLGVIGLMVIGLLQTVSVSSTIIHTFITNQQRDKALAHWARERIPAGATLFTFNVTLTLKHYTTLDVHDIFYETPETLAEKWEIERANDESKNDYLLLNVWDINHQWEGRAPQVAYQWLRDERGLLQMARFGNYTLFKIRP
jgi:4-amino-4-deoxy-L-arabinose transferase-like glycosyltransferase